MVMYNIFAVTKTAPNSITQKMKVYYEGSLLLKTYSLSMIIQVLMVQKIIFAANKTKPVSIAESTDY